MRIGCWWEDQDVGGMGLCGLDWYRDRWRAREFYIEPSGSINAGISLVVVSSTELGRERTKEIQREGVH
jgi:hypothetical protein